MKKLMLVVVLVLLAPVAAHAQEDVENGGGLFEKIRKINEVIQRSKEAREAGVPEEDVKIILEESQKRDLPPEETGAVLAETTEAVKESGPVDNFGAFVQARLDEGLRGRDLANAIHEEHRLRGKGQGHGKGHGKGHKKGKGHDKNRAEDRDHSDDGDEHDGDDLDGHEDDHDDTDEEHSDNGGGKSSRKGKDK